MLSARIQKMGNSSAVYLNKKLLAIAGINNETNVVIEAKPNMIVISRATKRRVINRDLSTWRKQMETAIKNGEKPEKSLWGNSSTSSFDKKEW